MKTLLVMRHGKSDWSTAETTPDVERPLTGRGKRDAASVAGHLARLGQIPDAIVHSPAKRCRSTVKRLLKPWPAVPQISEDERLYLHGAAGCVAVVAGLPDDAQRALIVGHNPALEEFVQLLTGQHVPLPTATVACLQLPVASWQEVTGVPTAQLLFLLEPSGALTATSGVPAAA